MFKRILSPILPLSDQGYQNLHKGIFACTLKNTCDLLPFLMIWQIMEVVLGPVLRNERPDLHKLMILSFLGCGCGVITLLTAWLQDRANNIPTYHETDRMRRSAMERLSSIPMKYLNDTANADIVGALMNDIATCEVAISGTIPYLFGGIFALIPEFILLSIFDLQLTLVCFAVIPFAVLIQALSLRMQGKLSRIQMNAKQALSKTLYEYIEGMPVLKAYGIGGEQYGKLVKDLLEVKRVSIRLELGAGLYITGAEAVLRVGIGLVFFAAFSLFGNGSISLLTLLFFVMVSLRIYDPVADTLDELSALVYMREALRRLSDYFHLPVEEKADGVLDSFEVSFSDVSFSYSGAETAGGKEGAAKEVLHHVSFTADQGAVTALVGPSGSGKSTILQLITGLYAPQSGVVTIGGKNIAELSTESINRYISVVDQNVVLFSDTLLNNIRLGKPNATDEEVIAAAKAAKCHDFITRLDQGYQTVIAENGKDFSEGERQRISIARAILKDAPILLLDEATSSLDPENEKKVQQGLSALLKKGKTIITVAHRPTTVSDADKVLRLERGSLRF